MLSSNSRMKKQQIQRPEAGLLIALEAPCGWGQEVVLGGGVEVEREMRTERPQDSSPDLRPQCEDFAFSWSEVEQGEGS